MWYQFVCTFEMIALVQDNCFCLVNFEFKNFFIWNDLAKFYILPDSHRACAINVASLPRYHMTWLSSRLPNVRSNAGPSCNQECYLRLKHIKDSDYLKLVVNILKARKIGCQKLSFKGSLQNWGRTAPYNFLTFLQLP